MGKVNRLRALTATTMVALFALVAGATPAAAAVDTRETLLVGNNWDGTADVLKAGGNYRRIARINIIPDIEERMAEIESDPVRLGYFLAIRELIGEGNDQYVDDMYTTRDGELLIVSRPSLADVVGIDLDTGDIVWRF